jgi:hypothetical protein
VRSWETPTEEKAEMRKGIHAAIITFRIILPQSLEHQGRQDRACGHNSKEIWPVIS